MNIKEFKQQIPNRKAILGIDYGSKRMGLAVSDISCMISSSYKILYRKNLEEDLKELKKVDAQELQTKIAELEEKNKTLQAESESKLLETRKNLMLENSLMKANVKNSKAIKGMLELDKITIDGDELTGLDDQIKALKESDSYLFNIEEPTKTIDLGSQHSSQKNEDDLFARKVMGLSTD